MHAVAVLAVLMLAATFVTGSSTGGSATAAVPPPSAQLAGTFTASGSGVTWNMALVVYSESTSGALMPFTPAIERRRETAIRQFQEEVFVATDGRLGVSVDVYTAPLWAGVRVPQVVDASRYDVVAHMYPKFASEPLPSDIGVKYMGLAGPEAGGGFFHEYPFKVDGNVQFAGSLLWHETLHTATQYLLMRGDISQDALPRDDVHGRPPGYPSELTYFRDYVRGEVEFNGRSGLGLGVARLVQAGPPRLWASAN